MLSSKWNIFFVPMLSYKKLWVMHCHSSVFYIWHKFDWSFCFFQNVVDFMKSIYMFGNEAPSLKENFNMPPKRSFLQWIFSNCAKKKKERKRICQPMESYEWKNYPSCTIDKLPLVSHYPSLKFSHNGSMWRSDTWFRLTIVHFVWGFQHKRGIMLSKFMAPWCKSLLLSINT